MTRLRIRELLKERSLTPYRLAKMSKGRISESTAYRIVRLNGALLSFDADLVDSLLETLDIEPADLFVREPGKRRKRPATRKHIGKWAKRFVHDQQ